MINAEWFEKRDSFVGVVKVFSSCACYGAIYYSFDSGRGLCLRRVAGWNFKFHHRE